MLSRISLAALVAGMVCLATLHSAPVKPGGGDRHVDYTETFTQKSQAGAVVKESFSMVAIPGGDFTLGSPATEAGRHIDEGPTVAVRLKPFWLGKFEVTWDEFDLFYKTQNADFTDEATGKPLTAEEQAKRKREPADAVSRPTQAYVDESYGHPRDRHPAMCMTHHTAMKYCEWLSKKTGRAYRLPTEVEWEYACRAGTKGRYAIPDGAELQDYAWYDANSKVKAEGFERASTHAVGGKKPNAWGLFDMHGNVMEWCLDHFVPDAYTRFAKLPLTDGFLVRPCFKPTENKWSHVARGGHFKSDANGLRSAARKFSDQSWMKADSQEPQSIWWLTNMDTVGFRVCRSLADEDLKGIVGRVPKENDSTYKP